MLEYSVHPITDRTWITPPSVESKFSANWTKTLDLLERELEYLDASDVLLGLDVSAYQVRNDGQLKGGASPHSHAVELSFESEKYGSQTHRLCRYERGYASSWNGGKEQRKMVHDYQHNVRAIALTLEHLRAIDRYGSGRGEAYVGFKALGAGTGQGIASGMTASDAFELIARAAGYDLPAGVELPVPREVIRRAQVATHPDQYDGNREQWNLVEQAIGVLERAGKVRP